MGNDGEGHGHPYVLLALLNPHRSKAKDVGMG